MTALGRRGSALFLNCWTRINARPRTRSLEQILSECTTDPRRTCTMCLQVCLALSAETLTPERNARASRAECNAALPLGRLDVPCGQPTLLLGV